MRFIALVLLGLYSLFVARLTLADPSAGEFAFSLLYSSPLPSNQAEALANVALFVPAGFLLAIALRSPVFAAVVCVVASVGIELAQLRYLPSRVPSLADVQHNGLGGLVGAVVAVPLLWFTRPTAEPAGLSGGRHI